MTYTPEHLQALREALASGEHRVTYEGKSIEYRSVADLKCKSACKTFQVSGVIGIQLFPPRVV